jgi:ankyrin repeat protein
MADALLCVGFSKACKQARQGGGLPGYEPSRSSRARCLRLFLPPDLVRLIDALVRRLEHEDTLLAMNGGVLGTTLCKAARSGGLLDVRFLLARGVYVEHTTVYDEDVGVVDYWTALVWAADAGHLAVTEELLSAGASLQLDAALGNASRFGHAPVAALLLHRGADVHVSDDLPLYCACRNGHLDVVRILLDGGADIHALDDWALRVAAEVGNFEIARMLLDRGASVQADDNQALRLAAGSGFLEIVRLVLDRGADVHVRNEYALAIARQNGNAALEALLLERGALEPDEE